MEHFIFFTRKQLSDEKFDKYYAQLRILVKTCNFDDIKDNLLRTQIVLDWEQPIKSYRPDR